MFLGPLNECTSWTNRLWASLSAFSGTVEQSVLPCRLKVEICKTMQEFIQQEKQTRENTTNRPQHIVNIVKLKLKTKLLKTCPCGLSWTLIFLCWWVYWCLSESSKGKFMGEAGCLFILFSSTDTPYIWPSAIVVQTHWVISIAAALVLRLSLSVTEKPSSISTLFTHLS